MTLIAQKHIYKQLARTKRIAASPAFAGLHVADAVAAPPAGASEANVTARLYNSNPAKQVMPAIMADVRVATGVADTDPRQAKQSKRSSQADQMEQSKHELGQSKSSEHDCRLGSSSASESEPEPDAACHYPTSLPRAEPSSRSPSPSGSASTSEFLPNPAASKPSKPPAQTTFLPSLMGGYLSGSDSASDPDDDPDARPARKNRMGQQARRMLWEKKFGANANHLRKQRRNDAKAARSRDAGWDLKRGATAPDERPRKQAKSTVGGGTGKTQGKPRGGDGKAKRPTARSRSNRDDTGHLHPSWEAAKKAKQQRPTAQFQGKKVVFD